MKSWDESARFHLSRGMSLDRIREIYGKDTALRVSTIPVEAVEKPVAQTQGERWKARRDELGMSRPQLAAYVGCKEWTIKFIESDCPVRLNEVQTVRLSAFYGLTPAELTKALSSVRLAA